MRGVRWVVVLLALVCAPSAHAAIFLSADATSDKGYVRLGVIASTSLTDVHVGEVRRGRFHWIKTLSPVPYGTFEEYGELSGEQVPRAARWRCDRLSRLFRAYGTTPEGEVEYSDFAVRTPSCRNRLRLTVPPRARGRTVRLRLEDTFRRGDVSGRLCRRFPGRPARCATLRVPSGRRYGSTTLRLGREGHWRITLRTPHQRIRRAVAVGTRPRPQDLALLPGILATGDSLMQGLDAVLEDRLTGLATVDTDVRIGSRLFGRVNGNWATLPARQVRKFRPQATVLFLGGNDGAPIRRADGSWVGCCDKGWVQAYSERVRRTMRTYVRNGRGRVYWLSLPAARDDLRTMVNGAVNRAIARAAASVPGARALDMVSVFTPGGAYTDTITYRGRRVRVRQGDGIHLTTRGAQIAADVVIDQLEKDGVL